MRRVWGSLQTDIGCVRFIDCEDQAELLAEDPSQGSLLWWLGRIKVCSLAGSDRRLGPDPIPLCTYPVPTPFHSAAPTLYLFTTVQSLHYSPIQLVPQLTIYQDVHSYHCAPLVPAQRTHNAIITSFLHQNHVVTSFWHNNDLSITSCACWGILLCTHPSQRDTRHKHMPWSDIVMAYYHITRATLHLLFPKSVHMWVPFSVYISLTPDPETGSVVVAVTK